MGIAVLQTYLYQFYLAKFLPPIAITYAYKQLIFTTQRVRITRYDFGAIPTFLIIHLQ